MPDGDPVNPFSSLVIRTRPNMPAGGTVGIAGVEAAVVVVLALMLCETDVWPAPHPVTAAQMATQSTTTRGRIGGDRVPSTCPPSPLTGRRAIAEQAGRRRESARSPNPAGIAIRMRRRPGRRRA